MQMSLSKMRPCRLQKLPFPLLMLFTMSKPSSVAIIATGRAAKADLNCCRRRAWNIDRFWDTDFRPLISVKNKSSGRQRFPFVISVIRVTFLLNPRAQAKRSWDYVDEAPSGVWNKQCNWKKREEKKKEIAF